MKKTMIVLLCLAGMAFSIQAQVTEDMVSKKGVPILPEQGDIALAIDAVPVFQFLGNMFNGSTGNSIGWHFLSAFSSSNTLCLQYYLEDKVSVRGGVRLGNVHTINQEFVVQDQTPIPDPNVLVTDKMCTNNTNVFINGSYLMHRGKGRVQGYYGAGVTMMYRNYSQNYVYGNDITTTFNSPATTDFGSNVTGTGRVTDLSNVISLGVGVQAIIGVDYFFAPKMSIGCEFGFGLMGVRTNGGQVTEERWNGTTIETETTNIANDGNITLDNSNASGSIFLKFHF
jgi:hypothetical protein